MSQHPTNTPAVLPAPDVPIGRGQKLFIKFLWVAVLLLVGGVIIDSSLKKWWPGHPEMQVLFHAPPFHLVDQDGQPFSEEDLRHKAYICDFIFTTCGSACPLMSQKMAEIQRQTPPTLHLVSFTVNPEHDTPAVLKAYAAQYGADPGRWHFATGTPEQMTSTAREMKIGVQPASDKEPILHSEKMLLIDGDGNIRGIYDSNDPQSVKQLIVDATWLAGTRYAHGG